MRNIRDLDPIEIRVLGALLEKEQATPDYYPLTVNALLAAVNQKTNRDPVTSLTEEQVVDALDRLRHDTLTWRSEGARAERWSQGMSRRLELDRAGKAILTLLMLRGPQTAGELRSRGGRLHAFGDLGEVEAALARLAEGDRPLVVKLARRHGQKEERWAHLLGGEVEEETAPAVAASVPTAPRAAPDDLAARVASLEARVASLEAALGPAAEPSGTTSGE